MPVGVIEERLSKAKFVGGGSKCSLDALGAQPNGQRPEPEDWRPAAGFCKVYMLECWDRRIVGSQRSPAFNKPVIIKLSSAGFKTGLSVAEQENEQANLEVRMCSWRCWTTGALKCGLATHAPIACLQAHWNREKHAHLVLEGQSRVVRVFHTFQGRMLVPFNGARVPMKARALLAPVIPGALVPVLPQ